MPTCVHIYITAFIISDLASFLGHLHASKVMQSLRSLCAQVGCRMESCQSLLLPFHFEAVRQQHWLQWGWVWSWCTAAGPQQGRSSCTSQLHLFCRVRRRHRCPKKLPWHTQDILGSSVRFSIPPEDHVANSTLLGYSLSTSGVQRHMAVMASSLFLLSL